MSTRSDFTTGDNMICMDQYHFGVSTEISQIYGIDKCNFCLHV